MFIDLNKLDQESKDMGAECINSSSVKWFTVFRDDPSTTMVFFNDGSRQRYDIEYGELCAILNAHAQPLTENDIDNMDMEELQ